MGGKMTGYCGLDCSECGAFKATAANDDAMRRDIAKEWSKTFGHDVTPESINCTGCASPGVRLNYCEICDIRKCAVGRQIDTCADCAEYACGKLQEFHKMAPAAKQNLDNLRSGRAGS